MKTEVYTFGGLWYWKCSGCKDAEGPYGTEAQAKIALNLHKIGCKKS